VVEVLCQTLMAVLPRLRRFGLALTGSPADADKLVQSVYERVLSRAGSLRSHRGLDAGLYGAMRNMWIEELRYRTVQRHGDPDPASDIAGEDGRTVAEGQVGLANVRRAMMKLSSEQRTVLMLVCVDGLSYNDAAVALGIPVEIVMSRLSRARLELHDRLGAGAGDIPGGSLTAGR
jgi:RNA polymerase sigma-70 factor (ECF subfamily)